MSPAYFSRNISESTPTEHIVKKFLKQKRGPNEGIFRDVLTLVVGAGIKIKSPNIAPLQIFYIQVPVDFICQNTFWTFFFSPICIWRKEKSKGTHELLQNKLTITHANIY